VSTIDNPFACKLTPHIQELIDASDAKSPIARQFMPSDHEHINDAQSREDPIGDERFSPMKGITHRYPDRLLLKPTYTCAAHCRFCFRRKKVFEQQKALSPDELIAALNYIREHAEIWEVILTGGDPFMLSASQLIDIVKALNEIEHVAVIRIHTRVPIVASEKITLPLIQSLKVDKPLYIVVHCNHARELTEDVRQACALFIDNGFPMLSQTVLLKGVNNAPDTMIALFRALIQTRIKPYYLHHCDLVKGASHFRTSIKEGQEIMRALRGHLSGICQPVYILDIPEGFGKVPIGPNYLIETTSEFEYHIEDFRGNVHSYIDKHASKKNLLGMLE